ncbi:PepSY domain-containing protein [Muricauda sp. AC10]|nr:MULTISPECIES: PepSY domain-containing protein [Allomuricauda]MDC6365402.1 PepSY domain-containing protein [Muricauda sp. AC10]
MTKRQFIQFNRKWHRYLGVILGVQFFLWTLGGLYFSWTNIDEIRGDNLKKKQFLSSLPDSIVPPTQFLNLGDIPKGGIQSIALTTILEKPVYRVTYTVEKSKKVKLFDAVSGKQKLPLTGQEAVQLAKESLTVKAAMEKVEFLTESGKHHEYRGRPLPVYAITFAKPANTTIYVSPEYGNVQTYRNNQWRAFDFLWMLHTMDYEGRDNFNNLLLRAFALFGLFTILSGFTLFVLTSKRFSRKKHKFRK